MLKTCYLLPIVTIQVRMILFSTLEKPQGNSMCLKVDQFKTVYLPNNQYK